MSIRSNSLAIARLASLDDDQSVVAFFGLTVLLSWGLWIPVLARSSSVTQLHVIPGAFGPAVAAVLVGWLRGASLRDWLREGFAWRLGARWYALALGLPVVAGVVMGGLFAAGTGSVAVDRLTRFLPTYPLVLVMTVLVGGGQEEFGWRGVALPALQERFDALTASVVVGVVWAVWHLPLFAFGVRGYAGRSFLLYAAVVVGFSVILTWLYNGTDGSILLAMVLHGGFNAAASLGGSFVTDPTGTGIPVLLAYGVPVWTVASALVYRYGRESLAPGDAVTGVWEQRGSEPAERPT